MTWSYLDYLRDVEIVAKAFIALGLEPHNAVCIFGMIFCHYFFVDKIYKMQYATHTFLRDLDSKYNEMKK